MIRFTILGEPVSKQRPRVTKWGTYTPDKTVNYENLVKQLYISEGLPQLVGELEIEVVAYFVIPKSISKKKRDQMNKGIIRPTKKPDLDNIIKIISDALNTIAYHDDSQIVKATIEKYYSDNPRVEVVLQEVGKGAGV